MWRSWGCLAVVIVCSCSEPPQPDESPTSPFVGAWTLVETTKTTPDSSWTDSSPATGLYIFTERHFSLMLIDAADSREPFPAGGASAEQRLAAYDPFIADAGTYEFDDITLRTRNIIAKVPNVMTAQIEHRYQIRGDSLTLTFSGAWAPPDGEITYRLVRLAEHH